MTFRNNGFDFEDFQETIIGLAKKLELYVEYQAEYPNNVSALVIQSHPEFLSNETISIYCATEEIEDNVFASLVTECAYLNWVRKYINELLKTMDPMMGEISYVEEEEIDFGNVPHESKYRVAGSKMTIKVNRLLHNFLNITFHRLPADMFA